MIWILALCAFLVSCSNDKIAGGKTVETTNGISGSAFIEGENGLIPVSNGSVELIPQNQLPTQTPPLRARTNALGEWSFDTLPPAPFNLLFKDSLNTVGALVEILDSVLKVDSLHLKPLASISINIQNLPLQIGDTLGLVGTPYYSVVDSQSLNTGFLNFLKIPAAKYADWIVLDSNGEQEIEIPDLDLLPADSIQTSAVWPHQLLLQFKGSNLSPIIGTLFDFPLKWNLALQKLEDWDETKNFCLKDTSGKILPFEITHQDTTHLEFWINPQLITSGTDQSWILFYNANKCQSTTPIFPSDWAFHFHLGQKEFNGQESIAPFLLSDSNFYPEALTLSALVQPKLGMIGGEILSLGNVVGMRVDYPDTTLNTYNYSAYDAINAWHVLSSGQSPDVLQNGWVLLSLVIDPNANRFELYSNGELVSMDPSQSINPIDYINRGDTVRIGRHSYLEENYFFGKMDQIQIHSNARNNRWLRMQAINLLDSTLIEIIP